MTRGGEEDSEGVRGGLIVRKTDIVLSNGCDVVVSRGKNTVTERVEKIVHMSSVRDSTGNGKQGSGISCT